MGIFHNNYYNNFIVVCSWGTPRLPQSVSNEVEEQFDGELIEETVNQREDHLISKNNTSVDVSNDSNRKKQPKVTPNVGMSVSQYNSTCTVWWFIISTIFFIFRVISCSLSRRSCCLTNVRSRSLATCRE